MGKGGPSNTTQTVIQDLPPYARPYFQRHLSRAEGVFNQPYEAYQGQRLAQFSPDVLASHQRVRDLSSAGIPGLTGAMDRMGELGQQAQRLGQQDPSQFEAYQFDPTRQFTGEEVERYMSPYMDAVVQRQQQDAMRQFEMMGGSRNARAIGAGAFGGSRQAIQEGLAEESLGRQMGDISATGRQQAFESAARQFASDRAAQMTTEQQRAMEQARVQSQTADESLRQRAFELQTMGFSADAAMQQAMLGERARAGDIQAAQLLERIGMQQMSQQQAGMDIAYEDFLRQQQYPQQQTAFMADLLRGLPIAGGFTQQTQQPRNPLQDLLGLGISGVGLYNAMRS
jgi:hypothetical protein